MKLIKRALISVSDKTNLLKLASELEEKEVEILSTGNTAKFLRENSFKVIDVESYTGAKELFGGRVKTLHPKIYAGILARRNFADDMLQLQEQAWGAIDLVVVNLYPFEKVISQEPSCSLEEAIENIDIGGPCMLRAAAKNYHDVSVVCDPDDYEDFIAEFSVGGSISLKSRFKFACKVFQRTASYDKSIMEFFARQQ